MISVTEAISDLLFVRDTVVVPGLGAFVKKPISAKVNPAASYFAMPSADVEFDANLREDNELLVRYLSEKNEISEDEAKKMLAEFVSDCFNTLKNEEKVVLNGIGTLLYDWHNDLAFEQDKTVNYNGDTFGLSDFTLVPVMHFQFKEEIKVEVEQQNKDKNPPVSVNEKDVHELDKDDMDDETRRRGWLWALLGVVLLVIVGYGLYYLKMRDLGNNKSQPARATQYEPKTYTFPSYSWNWEWEEEVPEANIQIIGGCYDREENAVRFVNVLKDKGYLEAFCELRNGKWYVSFGRYATMDEATAALHEIKANTEYKAWILK